MPVQAGSIQLGSAVKVKDNVTTKFQNAKGFVQEERLHNAWLVLLLEIGETILNPPLSIVINSQALDLL